MTLPQATKTLVQCDFDGTITERDVSYLILDAFAEGNWRPLLQDYEEGKIPVGEFNTKAFAMVKADEATLLKFIDGKIMIRPGLQEMVDCCDRKGLRLVVVSNGLLFYVKAMLEKAGLEKLEMYAAHTRFQPAGMEVCYIGPDGKQMHAGLKEAYSRHFLRQDYRLIYVGNGASDVMPAQYADKIFARDTLLASCKEKQIECQPFNNLSEVTRILECM